MKERELVHHFPILVADETIPPEAIIRQADTLLYQAKQEGRNRVKGGEA